MIKIISEKWENFIDFSKTAGKHRSYFKNIAVFLEKFWSNLKIFQKSFLKTLEKYLNVT